MKNKLVMKTLASWWGFLWREALPSGNGIIGAAVYGAVHEMLLFSVLGQVSILPALPAKWRSGLSIAAGADGEVAMSLNDICEGLILFLLTGSQAYGCLRSVVCKP